MALFLVYLHLTLRAGIPNNQPKKSFKLFLKYFKRANSKNCDEYIKLSSSIFPIMGIP